MSDFVIIADASCDLSESLRARFHVENYVAGTLVFPDGHTEKTDLDWRNISPEFFYGSMQDKKTLYTTSLPNTADMAAVFEPYLKEGKDILFVTISTGLSGTYQTALLTSSELKKAYPERTITVVDSLHYSSAVGLLLTYAGTMKEEGKSLEEIANWLNCNKYRLHQMGPLDDLFFCQRMGRISATKAISGTLIGIRPMADVNRNGLSQVIGKCRGKKSALNATIRYMQKTIENPEDQIIFLTHSNRIEEAKQLKQMIEAEFSPKEVIITDIGQFCGISIGPGLVAAFYLGSELSESLTQEAAILSECTK